MILIFLTLFTISVRAQQKECEQYDSALGPRGELSHLARVQFGMPGDSDFRASCVGIVISSSFVLTDAQCTFNPKRELPVSVRLGEDRDPTVTPIDVNIKKVHNHPDYKQPKKYNNVALLEFEPVSLTRYVQPACLSNYTENTTAFTWGLSETIEVKNMQKIDLSVLDNEKCESLLETLRHRNWNGMRDNQMCAIEIKGKEDICAYSGSPIQVESDDQEVHIVGMLSFGPKCGSPRPSVYNRVSKYHDWIKSIVWPEK